MSTPPTYNPDYYKKPCHVADDASPSLVTMYGHRNERFPAACARCNAYLPELPAVRWNQPTPVKFCRKCNPERELNFTDGKIVTKVAKIVE